MTVTAVAGTRSLGNDDDSYEMDMDPAITEPFDVYDLSGRMVKSQVTSLDGLPKGIYVVKGKKVMK